MLAAVRLVVHASNPRWALNYARDNGVELPLYFDRDNRFGDGNEIESSPMLLLVDTEGKVAAAHYPLPETPEWSDPFHDRILQLLQLI